MKERLENLQRFAYELSFYFTIASWFFKCSRWIIICRIFTIVQNLLHGKQKRWVFFATEVCPKAGFYQCVVALNLYFFNKSVKVLYVCKPLYGGAFVKHKVQTICHGKWICLVPVNNRQKFISEFWKPICEEGNTYAGKNGKNFWLVIWHPKSHFSRLVVCSLWVTNAPP